jgi:uncharacterized protein (DUF488 family)
LTEDSRRRVIFTVGHSTRSAEELAAILNGAGVRALADVRAYPSSRRHPQFDRAALQARLAREGIGYRHLPQLGGRRKPRTGSPNGAWREPAFRGYADHMASGEFATGMAALASLAGERAVAIMCAEALWWRCHRRLIADALTVRGWRVLHLGIGANAVAHEPPPFMVVSEDGVITYPPAQLSL